MLMLKAHLDAVEKLLMASYEIAGNSGHSLHKGTPREGFIKNFLLEHIGTHVSVGSGELIDCRSETNEPRNQHDIVLYQSAYPKVHFGNAVNAFLAESVIATVEVKSKLTKKDLKQAIGAANGAKQLEKHTLRKNILSTDRLPPRTYVVAYDGPASLKTVYKWIATIHTELGLQYAPVPHQEFREQMVSPSIDGVFILGKGFLYFGNTSLSFLKKADAQQPADIRWVFSDQNEGNLLFFFLLLTEAISKSTGVVFDPLPYAADFVASSISVGS